MRRIIHIAKGELAHLFYSPMAWVAFIGTYLLVAVRYLGLADFYNGQYEIFKIVSHVTSLIMHGANGEGYLTELFRYAYIIIPLLTMGTVSREYSGGTIKLLYASPLRIREVVLGKYLALLGIIAFLLCSVVLVNIGMSFSIHQPDVGLMVGSLFGVFLVFAAYAALGLFLSSITSYQLVAGMSTIGVIFMMGKLSDIEIDNRWFLDITYNTNLGLRAERLKGGLINTGDISFLMLFIISFLSFAVIRLKTQQTRMAGYKQVSLYAAVVILALAIGSVTTSKHYNLYWDSSREQNYSVTKETEELLNEFDKDSLKLTIYSNLFNGYNYHKVFQQNYINNSAAWPMLIRYRPDVPIEYVYYYGYSTDTTNFLNRQYRDQYPGKTMEAVARLEARRVKTDFRRFSNVQDVKKLSDVESENWMTYYELTYKGDTSRFNFFGTHPFYPQEQHVAAALKKLLYGPTKIGFLTDGIAAQPYEIGKRSFGWIALNKSSSDAWINNGYTVDTLSLTLHVSNLDRYDVLCLMDARTVINDTLLRKLEHYIDGGGNLYLGLNPDRQELVKPLLTKIGVTAKPGVVLQDNGKDKAVYKVFAPLTSASDFNAHFKEDKYWRQLAFGDEFVDVGFSEACALEYEATDGFHVAPLAVASGGNTWSKVFTNNEDSLRFASMVREDTAETEYIMALKLTRERNGKNQQIIVVGDGEFMSFKNVARYSNPDVMNIEFINGMNSTFGDHKYPAIGVRPRAKDVKMNYTGDSFKLHKAGMLYIVPVLAGLLGAILLLKRKRR